MTEEEIIDAIIATRDLLEEAYESNGITLIEMESKQVTFLEEERTAAWIYAKIGDVEYYVLQLGYFKVGEYSVTITLASYIEDNTENLLDLFYKLD